MTDTQKNFDSDAGEEFSEQELQSLRSELSPLMGRYKTEVLDQVEPSAHHRAAMHTMIMGLVRDDVLEVHRESSLATRLGGRWQRWMAAWRELARTSFLFRIGTQGAFALGLGLLLSMAWISSIEKGQVSADTVVGGPEEIIPEPVWTPREFDQNAQPPSPLGDMQKHGRKGLGKKK